MPFPQGEQGSPPAWFFGWFSEHSDNSSTSENKKNNNSRVGVTVFIQDLSAVLCVRVHIFPRPHNTPVRKVLTLIYRREKWKTRQVRKICSSFPWGEWTDTQSFGFMGLWNSCISYEIMLHWRVILDLGQTIISLGCLRNVWRVHRLNQTTAHEF